MNGGRSGQQQATSLFQSAAKAALEASRHVSASIAKGIHKSTWLIDYDVDQSHCIHVGPWQVHRAIHSKKGGEFSVWTFDKAAFSRTFNIVDSRVVEETFERCRKDARQCSKLRHPNILHLVEPVFESRQKIVLVSEGIRMSLDALSCDLAGDAHIQQGKVLHGRGTYMSELEIKFGLTCICEAMNFLHENGQLLHRGICPSSIVVSTNSIWKICGFQYSTSLTSRELSMFSFYEMPLVGMYGVGSHPVLQWTPPELVDDSWRTPVAPSVQSDYFSFGSVALWALKGQKSFPDNCSLDEYRRIVSQWKTSSGASLGSDLEGVLHGQVSLPMGERPCIRDVLICLSNDKSVQALKFLMNTADKTDEQKLSFLREASSYYEKFGSTITSNLLVPFLLESLRNDGSLRSEALCVLLKACKWTDTSVFERDVLPVLKQIVSHGSEVDIEEIVRNIRNLSSVVSGSAGRDMLFDILKRSIDVLSPKMQKLALESVAYITKESMYPSDAMKRFIELYVLACLRTNSSQVRTTCLKLLYDCLEHMSPSMMDSVFDQIKKCSAVDSSGMTSVLVARLVEGMCQHTNMVFSSKKALPLLTSMLSDEDLGNQQFQDIYSAVEKILKQIKASRIGDQRKAAEKKPTAAETWNQGIFSDLKSDATVGMHNNKGKSSQMRTSTTTIKPSASDPFDGLL
jgi:SCY1-like protein 2